MWIASKWGWFSVVETKESPFKIMVRARERADLEGLKHVAGIRAPIIETPKADYRFRVVVPRKIWAGKIMPALAASVTYENFKGEIHNTPEQAHKSAAYSRIWGIMERLQPGDDYTTRMHTLPFSLDDFEREYRERVQADADAEFADALGNQGDEP